MGQEGGQWPEVEKGPSPLEDGVKVGTFTGPQGERDACEGKAPIFRGSPAAAPSYCLALERLSKISKDWLALGWLSTTWLCIITELPPM